jgi:hypothetical protein
MRKLVNFQPIESYDFSPLNLKVFHDKAIIPALELTDRDRLRSKYSPYIQNHSPFSLPSELSRENLQKLELGLLNQIAFSVDQKQFSLTFDKTKEEFIFSYNGLKDDPALIDALYKRNKKFTLSSPLLNVSERKLDGTTTTHPLQHSVHVSYHYGPWYNLEEKWHCEFQSGKMAMKMNSECTIPLSQGTLHFQLFRR